MNGHLVTLDGEHLEVTTAEIERLLASHTPFWLDLLSTLPNSPEQQVLRDTFHFHPLALEDAEHFGQRPKFDTYDDFGLLVVYGPGNTDHLVEVHCFCSENFLVTVHQHPCPAFPDVLHRMKADGGPAMSQVMVLYRVLDMLIDGYFPVLAAMDDQIDDLEDEILKAPTDEQLGRLFDMKRALIVLRKIVTPERDMFATLVSGSSALPGMTAEYERYFRDLYDHLIRVSDLVDSYRDLLSGAMDTHLSTVSNRLNVVMKQLTIIATIILPLSFLTGFFGQNFGWMVNRIGSFAVFVVIGIGTQILTVTALVVMFRKRGWLTSDGMVPPATPAARHQPGRHMRWLYLHPMRGRGWPPQPVTPAAGQGGSVPASAMPGGSAVAGTAPEPIVAPGPSTAPGVGPDR
jgi:magnesium transporter